MHKLLKILVQNFLQKADDLSSVTLSDGGALGHRDIRRAAAMSIIPPRRPSSRRP